MNISSKDIVISTNGQIVSIRLDKFEELLKYLRDTLAENVKLIQKNNEKLNEK